MKHSACSAALALMILSGVALADAPATQPAGVGMPRTSSFELAAADGYAYQITIAEPKGEPPPGGFAVLYVLDANPAFFTVAEATRFQKGLVPTVVVGIGAKGESLDYARRYKDFTPPTPAEHLIRRSNSSEGNVTPEGTGGQDAFLAFIENTLKPDIVKRYKTDPSRQVILGHSLSARFVLHVLATKPEAFSGYIASSPSIWWDNASLLKEIDSLAATKKVPQPKTVVISVGEFEQKTAPGTAPDRVAFFNQAKMVDNARAASEKLKTVEGLTVSFSEYEGENHGSVLAMAIGRGLRITLAPAPK